MVHARAVQGLQGLEEIAAEALQVIERQARAAQFVVERGLAGGFQEQRRGGAEVEGPFSQGGDALALDPVQDLRLLDEPLLGALVQGDLEDAVLVLGSQVTVFHQQAQGG